MKRHFAWLLPVTVATCFVGADTLNTGGSFGLVESSGGAGAFGGNEAADSCENNGVAHDNLGVNACLWDTDATPRALVVSGHNGYPAASTNTGGGNVYITPGGEAIRGAVTAANFQEGDTVTLPVGASDNTYTAGADFECTGTDQECAAELAALLDGIAGVNSCAGTDCTSFTGVDGTFYVYTDPAAQPVWIGTLARSRTSTISLTQGERGKVIVDYTPLGATSADIGRLYFSDAGGNTGAWFTSSGTTPVMRCKRGDSTLMNNGSGCKVQASQIAVPVSSTSTTDAIRIDTGGYHIQSSGSSAAFFTSSATTVTLAAAATAIAVTRPFHKVDCDSGGNTIATITGGASDYSFIILMFVDASCTITDTDAATPANTVNLSAAYTSAANDILILFRDGSKWFEASRSVNG